MDVVWQPVLEVPVCKVPERVPVVPVAGRLPQSLGETVDDRAMVEKYCRHALIALLYGDNVEGLLPTVPVFVGHRRPMYHF